MTSSASDQRILGPSSGRSDVSRQVEFVQGSEYLRRPSRDLPVELWLARITETAGDLARAVTGQGPPGCVRPVRDVDELRAVGLQLAAQATLMVEDLDRADAREAKGEC